MDPRAAHVIGALVAGACLGTCLAFASAQYAAPPQRRRSWKQWSGWRTVFGDLQRTSPALQPGGEAIVHLKDFHNSAGSPSIVVGPSDDDEIIREQFTRNEQFFGNEGQARVRGAFVVVVGLGGVGSHAASMLLRSGVGRLRVVDFDQVSLSSLNRHAVAVRDDVGTPKAACLQRHFAAIFPEAHVDARALMYDTATEDEVLAGSPDFVLDCIDNIDTKVALLAACKRRGLQVISATGAGGRADPTRVRLADLSESTEDPLSRAVRMRLRRQHGIQDGIPVVFSTEKPKAGLLPFEAPGGVEANPADYQVVPGFRVRTIPVMGALPAMFGLVMAAHVVTRLARLPVTPEPILRLGREHYGMLHRRLLEREELRFGSAAVVDVDEDEVVYIAREMWRGRSARDQAARDVGRGMYRAMNYMCLTRWDASKPPTIDNLIMLTFEEAEEHDARQLEGIRQSEPEFYAMVTAVLQRARNELA